MLVARARFATFGFALFQNCHVPSTSHAAVVLPPLSSHANNAAERIRTRFVPNRNTSSRRARYARRIVSSQQPTHAAASVTVSSCSGVITMPNALDTFRAQREAADHVYGRLQEITDLLARL